MRVLVLGGTKFVGRAVVAEAVARGWPVTTFNRGVTGSSPAEVESIRGDRTVPADLNALAGRRWDAVVDTWTGAPRVVAAAARLLAGQVGHYGYVSSGSVYQHPIVTGITEDAPVVAADPEAEDGQYAAVKAGGELAVRAYLGDERSLLARAGTILGPYEEVGRLPWWLVRVAQGGDMVAPGPADLPMQWVDVRDLAAWMLDGAERGLAGAYNTASPRGHTTMASFLEICRQVTGSTARLRWIEPETILAAGVSPWSHLPVWIPPDHPYRPMQERNTGRAAAAGLRCRPPEQTIADTWDWLRADGRTTVADWLAPTRGLSPETETGLLSDTRV